MFERFVGYALGLSESEIPALLIQDVALLRVWSVIHITDPGQQEKTDGVAKLVDCWQKTATPDTLETSGRRHQHLLRDLIDALERKDTGGIRQEEWVFLQTVEELRNACADSGQFKRLTEVLGPHLATVRNSSVGPPRDPAWLDRRILYVTEADLLAAPTKETRLLAGIELPSRGPVLMCPAHLRVIGDVPESCTVIIEGEAVCAVDGYVLGRVLSKKHCEVRGNVSGAAITLHGDVRARSVINNAVAIAKMESVVCRSAQGPKLVFGGKRIAVAEGTMLGHYITQNFQAGQDVRGGTVQVSTEAQARKFSHLGSNTLNIVLRKELSCEDFGEVTGTELKRLLSEAYRLRRLMHHLQAMADMGRHEIEHKAQTALMFLLGGGETHKKLEEINALQRRRQILARVINNLRDVLDSASGGLSALGAGAADSDIDGLQWPGDSDEPVDEDLLKETEEADFLRDQLRAKGNDRSQTFQIMDQTREHLERLQKEDEEAIRLIAQREKEMQSLEQYEQLRAGAGQNATKLQLLQRVLKVAKKQTTGAVASRVQSSYVTMALRTIERNLRLVTQYEKQVAENRASFQSVSERLGQEFQIEVLASTDAEVNPSRASGLFEAGVRIHLDAPQEGETEAPEGRVLLTKDHGRAMTYVRSDLGVESR